MTGNHYKTKVERGLVLGVCTSALLTTVFLPDWRSTLHAQGYYDANLVATLDSVTSPVVAGEAIEFSIGVSNNAANSAQNVINITSLPPEFIFISSSGCAEDPSGFPLCSLGNLIGNSGVLFSVNALVSPAASGEPEVTSVATSSTGEAVPGDEIVQFSTPIDRIGDVAISLDNGGEFFFQGGIRSVEYVLTVNNQGPSDASGVQVSFDAPGEMSDLSWVCFSDIGASCEPSGSDILDETVVLQSASQLIFLINGSVDVNTEGNLTAQAAASGPADAFDPALSNNVALDIDSVGLFGDGFEDTAGPRVGGPATVASGSEIVLDLASMHSQYESGNVRVAGYWLDQNGRALAFIQVRQNNQASQVQFLMTHPSQPHLISASEWLDVDTQPTIYSYWENGLNYRIRNQHNYQLDIIGRKLAEATDTRLPELFIAIHELAFTKE